MEPSWVHSSGVELRRPQKEDVSPHRGNVSIPFTASIREDARLFQMARLQKLRLKPLTLSDKNQIIWWLITIAIRLLTVQIYECYL